MSDDPTRTRFLGAIAAQIPADRVIEIHLFAPMRQGGMESGVAVIAVDPHGPAVPAAPAVAAANGGTADDAVVVADVETAADSVEAVLEEPVLHADGHVVAPDEMVDEEHAPGDASDHAGYDAPVDTQPTDAPPTPPAAARRYTVYTARYRHTLKGPDRGKWESSVTEEADAPLLTVDAVVRGVSRRSGDADETVRLSGDEYRAALPAPTPAAPVRPGRPAVAGRRG